MRGRAAAPLVMNVALILGITLLAWQKLTAWHGHRLVLGVGVCTLHVTWGLWETQLRYRVLDCLRRPSLDGLASGLCRKGRGLLGKRIDAFACKACRLLDQHELGKARKNKLTLLLEFVVANLVVMRLQVKPMSLDRLAVNH